MSTTDTLTKQPDTTRPDPTTQTATNPATPGNPRPQRPRLDDAPARVGIAFAIAAVIAVGALVWGVITGPTDASRSDGSYDRVELIRAATLRDLATRSDGSYDRVELIRAATLRDLATQSS